jgi:DnaK suppressor protein
MNARLQTGLTGVLCAIDARERELRDEIRDALAQSGDQRYIELAGQVHDLADEAVANELMEMENTLIERHVHELRELEAARERFAQDSINQCAGCGDEIGIRRLLASPTAVRCVVCQEQFDRTHMHEATPRL